VEMYIGEALIVGRWRSDIFSFLLSENGVHSGGINNGSVPLYLVRFVIDS
jgi:hypothetical protein